MRQSYIAAGFFLLLLTACTSTSKPELDSANTPLRVALPLEVIGPDGYVETISFRLEGEADALYIQCHRCGYNAMGERSGQAKASVKINGGAWRDLKDGTVNMDEPERAYGGFEGGYLTTRFRVSTDDLRKGENTVAFRFNGTDKQTSGYRVIDFNVLRGAEKLLPESSLMRDDPNLWSPPLSSASDIREGKALWEGAKLSDFPGGPQLEATCSGCHSRDGRDLQYYAFSNWSIQERSKFHGLSQKQGEQIASYIRSLENEGIKPRGRPWNPPYQPGPGLDEQPVEQWAAGAGLEAVLERDEDMLRYLFPRGTSEAMLAQAVDTKANLNVREMPVALQFPDWQAWLPTAHPEDIWGDLFLNGVADYAPGKRYREAHERLAASDPAARQEALYFLNRDSRRFIAEGNRDFSLGGSQWRSLDSTALKRAIRDRPAGTSTRAAREQAKLNLAKWSGVKQWELVQSYGLEDDAPELLPAGGELRAWPSKGQSVHPFAPHIVADDLKVFEGQPSVVGKYQSSVWYQLQMTVNSGQRQAVNVQPQDWPYQFRHILELAEASGVEQPLRYVQSLIEAYQNRDNGQGVQDLKGWQLRITHPWWLYSTASGDASLMDTLNVYERGLRNRVVGALLNEFVEVTRAVPKESWVRCSHKVKGIRHWFCVEPAGYAPQPYAGRGKLFEFPSNYHADNFYRLIPLLKENGVDSEVMNDLIDWCETMWPKGNWDRFK